MKIIIPEDNYLLFQDNKRLPPATLCQWIKVCNKVECNKCPAKGLRELYKYKDALTWWKKQKSKKTRIIEVIVSYAFPYEFTMEQIKEHIDAYWESTEFNGEYIIREKTSGAK